MLQPHRDSILDKKREINGIRRLFWMPMEKPEEVLREK